MVAQNIKKKSNSGDESLRERFLEHETLPATPTPPEVKGIRILAALHNSPLSISSRDLDQLDGLPPWINETPARKDFIKSVLRERHNPEDHVSMHPNLWGVPIGTVFPCPDWEVPEEDEEYNKKLAIARNLKSVSSTSDSSHSGGGLSPNDGTYGHIDSGGVFHPLPTLPTPERIRELEERKCNERGELSPSINRVRKEPGGYGSPESNPNNASPRPQPKSYLHRKASTPWLSSEQHLKSVDSTLNTGTRQGISIGRNDGSLTADNNTTEKQPSLAISGEQVKKKSSLFNMKKPMPAKKGYGPVTQVTPEKDMAKQNNTFYNLKQSLSFTKLSEPLLQSGTRNDTEKIKKESSLSSLKHSFSFTKPKEPAASFETTPERAEAEKTGGFKKFIKSFSPRKGSSTAAQTHRPGMQNMGVSIAMHVLEDGLPVNADRVKSSTTGPPFVTVAKPSKNGGLLGHMRKLRNINADDQFANHICGDSESDEDVDDIMITLVEAGFMDTISSKKQRSPRALKEAKCLSLPAGAGAGVLPDGSLAVAYASMGLQGLHGRSNSTARGLEARKMAKIKVVDADRSEANRYVSCCSTHAC